MSEPADNPVPYQVSYSASVRERIKALALAARERGDGEPFLAALREFDRRLRVSPQFGDSLTDLQAEAGQVRLGVVPPLAMRDGVLEERRVVLVAAPPMLMPRRNAE